MEHNDIGRVKGVAFVGYVGWYEIGATWGIHYALYGGEAELPRPRLVRGMIPSRSKGRVRCKRMSWGVRRWECRCFAILDEEQKDIIASWYIPSQLPSSESRLMRNCCGGLNSVVDVGPSRCACRTERGRLWSSICIDCSAGEGWMSLVPFYRPNLEFYVCIFRRTKGAGDERPVRDWIGRRRRDCEIPRLVCLARTCLWEPGLFFFIEFAVN